MLEFCLHSKPASLPLHSCTILGKISNIWSLKYPYSVNWCNNYIHPEDLLRGLIQIKYLCIIGFKQDNHGQVTSLLSDIQEGNDRLSFLTHLPKQTELPQAGEYLLLLLSIQWHGGPQEVCCMYVLSFWSKLPWSIGLCGIDSGYRSAQLGNTDRKHKILENMGLP